MSNLPTICGLSQVGSTDEDAHDMIISYPEGAATILEVGETRPFILDSEIGTSGTVVLSSMESLRQIFTLLLTQRLGALDEETEAAIQARFLRVDPDVPEEPMRYESLPGPRWTRLFRIDSMTLRPLGPNTFDVSISGSLKAFDLDNMPPYRALSYTWAPPYQNYKIAEPEPTPEISTSITCNDAVLRITDNLFSALCYLGTFGISGWIWIDAICINQTNEEEKAAQINQMDVVYSNAEEVIGWLGFAHVYVKDLVWATTDFIDRFASHENFKTSAFDWPAGSLYDPEIDQFFHVDDLVSSFFRLFFFYNACRWFKRAWVTQEVVLARKMRLFCGEFEISWDGLLAFGIIMSKTGWRAQVEKVAREQVARRENRSWLQELMTWQQIPNRISRLLTEDTAATPDLQDLEIFCHPMRSTGRYLACFHELLCWNRKFLCSEVRDFAFSAIGLADSEFKAAILASTVIKYTMEAKEFYTSIARCVLSNSRYLDVLVGAGIQNSESQTRRIFPSWVPNYLAPPRYGAFMNRGAQDLNAGLCEERKTATFRIQALHLLCEGSLFDVVEGVLDTEGTTFRLDLLQFCTAFPSHISGRPRLEVLWRTLILDSTFDGTIPAPDNLASGFMAMVASRDGPILSKLQRDELDTEEYFDRLDNYLDQLNATEVFGENTLGSDDVRQYAENFTQTSIMNPLGTNPLPRKIVEVDVAADQYMRSEDNARGRDLLFRTRLGFMGICGGPCAIGDQVWALCDAHVPFVLRKSEMTGDFELVGACFTLDKMQGEMMRNGVKVENIRIV